MTSPPRCEWCGVFVAKHDNVVTRWIVKVGWPDSRWRCVGRVLCPHCRASAQVPTPWRRPL